MKFKHFEDYLSRSRTCFKRPNILLEQYTTDPHLSACLLWTAFEHGDIEDRVILDLGCGSGMLSIAAEALDAFTVMAIDIDRQVFADFDHSAFDCIIADVRQGIGFIRNSVVDCIVTNPPFGTKNNAGIDYLFVKHALSIAPVCYSMHKTACREILLKKLATLDVDAKVLAEMAFEIPKMYHCHKLQSLCIQVDLIQTIIME